MPYPLFGNYSFIDLRSDPIHWLRLRDAIREEKKVGLIEQFFEPSALPQKLIWKKFSVLYLSPNGHWSSAFSVTHLLATNGVLDVSLCSAFGCGKHVTVSAVNCHTLMACLVCIADGYGNGKSMNLPTYRTWIAGSIQLVSQTSSWSVYKNATAWLILSSAFLRAYELCVRMFATTPSMDYAHAYFLLLYAHVINVFISTSLNNCVVYMILLSVYLFAYCILGKNIQNINVISFSTFLSSNFVSSRLYDCASFLGHVLRNSMHLLPPVVWRYHLEKFSNRRSK